MPDKLRTASPARPDVARRDSDPATPEQAAFLAAVQAGTIRLKLAASIHPSSASGTNPNRAKRHGARLPNTPRTSVKRDGLTRSGVTVMRVDPSTLKRSTAGGRNTSDRVLKNADVVARNVLSRRSIRKVAASV